MNAPHKLIGRESELRECDAGLDRLQAGRGSVLLVTGEAGIGKSRVLEAVETMASHRGVRSAWGRAWEAGGAPSFWPWIQIFRALDLPWHEVPSGPEGAEARFAQYDRVSSALAACARKTPLVLLIDDLHAADDASLQLLLFAARSLAAEPVMLAVAARDAEMKARELFSRLAREARCLAPRRLSLPEVAAWVGDQARAEQIHAKSDGLPLFVEELVQVGPLVADAHRIGAVLDAHLALLPESTRAVLERASVIGRTFDVGALDVDAGERDQLARALSAAVEARVLRRDGEGRYTFSHVLLRDRLYDALEPSRRQALHERLGASLAAAGDLSLSLHHLLRANPAGDPERIARLALDAAKKEMASLAFEGAASLTAAGLEHAPATSSLELELSLLRAEALIAAGAINEGREQAGHAHAAAEKLHDADGLARAALLYGREIFVGHVDPRLVQLLEKALAASPSPEHAPRLLARLAAARVPPKSQEEADWAIETATRALSQARALGDRRVLLETLRHVASAHGYMVPRSAQLALSEELFDVAVALGRSDITAEVAGFVYTTRREVGRLFEADEAFAALESALPKLGPHQTWRLAGARTTRALLDGELDVARAQLDELARIAARYRVHGARIAWISLCMGIGGLTGDLEIIGRVDPDELVAPPGGLFRTWFLAARGRIEEALPLIRALVRNPGGYPQRLLAGAACVLTRDAELAAEIRPHLAQHADKVETFFGPGGVYCAGPTSWVLADLDRLIGDEVQARAGYERALALCRTMRFVPMLRIIEQRLASGPNAPRTAPALAVNRPLLALTQESEGWRLSKNGEPVGMLPDVKGMAYLARLFAEPERDFHVLELIGAEYREVDAGPQLDDRAVSEYRGRIRELRGEIDQAESFGDLGRVQNATRELEALQAELARALGLGGRKRMAGSELERARVNVQRRLRDAVRRIASLDPSLGDALDRWVRTGTTCCYRP